MKKILKLLTLSTALLLSGCNLMPVPGGQSSSQAESSSTATPTTEPTGQSTTVTTAPTSSPTSTTSHPDVSHHCSFNMYGTYLPFYQSGVNISDQASGYNNRDKLQAAINEQAGLEIVSTLSADTCTIQTDNGNTTDQAHFHLTVGSGSASGYLLFSFSKDITKIVVSCRAYSKTTGTIDTGAKIIIDNEEHNLPTETGVEIQPLQTYEKEYSTATKQIRIANDSDHQRFFLETIELYY